LDRHAPILSRECTVFCGIGGELMEHHGHGLPSFRAQHDFGAAGFKIVACSIRCELAPDKLAQRYFPATDLSRRGEIRLIDPARAAVG
jgi:hypothetical protein